MGDEQEAVQTPCRQLSLFTFAHRILILSLCAVLASCATTRTAAPTRDASELTAWRASGRIAVASPNGGGSGSFTWQQNGSQAAVNLRGPIGIGALRLTIDGDELRIATGDGQEFESAAAREELAARLGATIPTQELRYWLVGVPAPGDHSWSEPAPDKATVLTQQDWRIEYQRYETAGGYSLPTKLVATGGQARVRIVIDKWKVE